VKVLEDVMDPAASGGFLPCVLQVGINDSSLELQAWLDEEYGQLLEDRRILCEFPFYIIDAVSELLIVVCNDDPISRYAKQALLSTSACISEQPSLLTGSWRSII
jgi:hypothetical protein